MKPTGKMLTVVLGVLLVAGLRLDLGSLLPVLIAAQTPQAAVQWVRKADMPTARAGCGAVALDQKLYVIGGAQGYEDSVSAVEVYDPATDRWSKRPDLPRPAANAGVAAHDGKIYVLNDDRLHIFDAAANAWTEGAAAPRAHRNFAMAECGGKLYALGGLEPTTKTKWGWQNVATLDVYDPAIDKWDSRASMQIARHALSVACASGKIYVLGGSFTFPDNLDRPFQVVEEYDPVTDKWRTAGDLAFNTAYVPALEVSGKILVLSNTSYSQEFDPATGRSQLNRSVPSARLWNQCAAVMDGKIYQAGGWTEPGKPVAILNVLEALPAQ